MDSKSMDKYRNRMHNPGRFRERGLSLVELMVSLAISATLLAGLSEILLAIRISDRTQEANSRMQESGQFAVTFLGEDVRMAGFMGCSSTIATNQVNNLMTGLPASFQPTTGIQGWEANNTDPGDISNHVDDVAVTSTAVGWGTSGGNVLQNINVVPGTDIIRVWGAGDSLTATSLAKEGSINSMSQATYYTLNTSVFNVSAGDILMISDCTQADIAHACGVTTVAGTPDTLDISLDNTCAPANTTSTLRSSTLASVNVLSGNLYFIGKRGDVATNPPALFRRPLASDGTLGTAVELVEGVANMQILYGENTNNDGDNSADSYVPADQVSNWTDVVSVRITFLVQSIENNLVPSPTAYSYNGTTYDGTSGNGSLPDDNRLRRVFTTTIGIRNRTL